MTLPPIVPAHNLVIISVVGGICTVARYRQRVDDKFVFTVQAALNWAELEPEARAAVQRQVGAIMSDEHHWCLDRLAARATWPESEEETI